MAVFCNLHRSSDSIKNAWDALRRIALKHVLDVGSKEPGTFLGLCWWTMFFFRKLIASRKILQAAGCVPVWWLKYSVKYGEQIKWDFFFFYNWAKISPKIYTICQTWFKELKKNATLHFVFLLFSRRLMQKVSGKLWLLSRRKCYSLNARESLAPLALWAAHWHEAPLCYLCPEFEFRLKDLLNPAPSLFHLTSCCSMTIMAKQANNTF